MEIHCPNPNCCNFKNTNSAVYKKKGFYKSKNGNFQRFRCIKCGCSFSERTFSINYWLHYTIDFNELSKKIFSSNSVRSIALDFKHSPSSISRRVQRLSRNLLAGACDLEEGHRLRENLCADGIQNFNVSQYFPCDYNILVGEESQYIFISTYSTFKRKGKMSKYQKRKLQQMYKNFNFSQFSTIQGFNYLVKKLEKLIINKQNESSTIFYTDRKQEYSYCLKQSIPIQLLIHNQQFEHKTISSKDFRDTKNKLFPVNYMDREMRKNLADMERETTRYSRNVCMALDRINIFSFYHNNIKKFRIKDPVSKNHIRHSHIAGFDPLKLEIILNQVFKKRYFYTNYRNRLDEFNNLLWERKIPTPRKKSKEYIPAFCLI